MCIFLKVLKFIELQNWTTSFLLSWWNFRSWVGHSILWYLFGIFHFDISVEMSDSAKSDNVRSSSWLRTKSNSSFSGDDRRSMKLCVRFSILWKYSKNRHQLLRDNFILVLPNLFVLRSSVFKYRRIPRRPDRIPCHHRVCFFSRQ